MLRAGFARRDITPPLGISIEGYYPVQSAYDEGGYEVLTARYVAGTAEKLIDTSLEIINSIK